jgi:pimeloyl-ACP methyl ester carboxylesterase
MANVAFPERSKTITLPSGRNYNYVYIPSQSLPVILFLHGFPSSSYDWRHQISYFSEGGYGVLVPDLLGYGGTDKPATAGEYTAKKVTSDVIGILDHEKVDMVHGVGHDIGSFLLSRLANYFPDRLLTCSFLAVPYTKPGDHFDLDMINAMTKTRMGYERFGYIKFFEKDEAGDMLNEHVSRESTEICLQLTDAMLRVRLLLHSILSGRPGTLDKAPRTYGCH